MKCLVLLAARGGAADSLDTRLMRDAGRMVSECNVDVSVFRQVPSDPFAAAIPCMRPFDATLDVRGDESSVLLAIAGIADRLDDIAHSDLSCALVGEDNVVISCAPTRFRYQYVMRRKRGTTHGDYLDYYANHHARFGPLTGGIEGYVQFHVDPDRSRAAASAAGVGLWRADSVSELHLRSVEHFLEGLAEKNPGVEATEDEERFVDRQNSVMFTSALLWSKR